MNGALFKFKSGDLFEEFVWDCACAVPPPICFSNLEKITVKEINALDHERTDGEIKLNEISQRIISEPKLRVPLAFSEADLQSDDESSYENHSHSVSSSDEDEDVLMAQDETIKVLFLGNFNVSANETRDLAYEPTMGAIIAMDTDDIIPHETLSIVEYLQYLSDMMDDCRAPLFFEFEDDRIQFRRSALNELRQKCKDHESRLRLYEEQSGTKGFAAWMPIIDDVAGWFNGCCSVVKIPRTIKMLRAAAQGFLVNVFSKAQAMETSDVLQVKTFIDAANSISPKGANMPHDSVTQTIDHFWLRGVTVSDKIIDL